MGSGDGLFGIDCHARQPALCVVHPHLFLVASLGLAGDGAGCWSDRLPSAIDPVGKVGAAIVFAVIAAIGAGAGSACGQGGLRCTALDCAWAAQLPTLGVGKVHRVVVCGRLHGAQDGCQGTLLCSGLAHGSGGCCGGGVAAGRTRHGCLHGDCRDRHGYSVFGWCECPHVLFDRDGADGGFHVDHCVKRMAARADLCVPRSMERKECPRQGLPIDPFADRHWAWRGVWRGSGGQCRKTQLAA